MADVEWKYDLTPENGELMVEEVGNAIANTDSIGDLTPKQIKDIIRGIATTNWA